MLAFDVHNGWVWLLLAMAAAVFAVLAFWFGVGAEREAKGSPMHALQRASELVAWALFLVMAVVVVWVLLANV